MKGRVANSDRSWAASPCSSCATSPCCTRLPLHRFHIESRSDFERARSILKHPRIELGLYDSGWWMAYYLAPCRFLNPLDSKCLVHGSSRQPEICRDYSPVRCWYKRVFAPANSEAQPNGADSRRVAAAYSRAGHAVTAHSAAAPMGFIRFDLRRFEELAAMIAFDDAGELSAVPDWELLHSRVTALPVVEAAAASAPAGTPPAAEGGGLIFPIRVPRSRRDLDLVRFRLGFHAVRIGVNGEEWVTVIGDPPDASRYLLVSYDGLDALFSSFTFDDLGRIVGAPKLAPARVIRAPEPGASR